MARLLTRILWRSHPRWQLLAGGGGFLLGLLLMMLAVHVYISLNKVMNRHDEGAHQYEYLIITKPVSTLNSLSLLSKSLGAGFNQRELNAIAEESLVKDMAPVKANGFDIQSNLSEDFDFYADLYFEAVPDRFLDTIPENWGWTEGDTLPIMLSKDWLDIYNFNVTMMYDMPQLSPETIRSMIFRVVVMGKGQRQAFPAQVVGFSYRLPSVLVPLDFLEWANDQYGYEQPTIGKVLIAVEDAASPEVKKWLEQKNYQASTEKTGRQSFRAMAQLVFSISGLIGLLFVILSLVIFVITLQLLLSQSKTEVARLIELGYTPGYLLRHVLRQFWRTLLLVGILAFVGYVLAGFGLQAFFDDKGLSGISVIAWASLSTLLVLLLLAFVVSRLALGRFMRTLYHR